MKTGQEIAKRMAGGNGVEVTQPESGGVHIALSGDWRIGAGIPSLLPVREALGAATGGPRRVVLAADGLGAWDSALPSYLLKLLALCGEAGAEADTSALPEGLRRLLSLALAVPERKDAARGETHDDFVEAAGNRAIAAWRATQGALAFIGEVVIAFGNFLRGRARLRGADFLLFAQECGAQALPIVTIISLLVGLILAFVGAVQLRRFGADIYVANLVAIAMSREMGAVMTAIVLAGRTGAAYAAQIGAMQGNEEVDALSTLGLPPIEFLVLPRVFALVLMTPLLVIYADLMGILGGYLVAIGMLNVTGAGYLEETQTALSVGDFAIGIGKGAVFGIIIAVTGCLKGIFCGRSAQAVGDATTSAVVTGILYIIVADGLFAVLLNVLGI